MKKILFIHQSAELYGSDKTLFLLLKNLDKETFYPVVILPFEGPLKEVLEKENIEVIVAPVLKLYRKLFTLKNTFNFFLEIKKAFQIGNALHKKHQFDLVYSNTLAVLFGILFAKKKKIKHLWHVHEIIKKPSLFKKGFTQLLALKSNSFIVYNSEATKQFWETKSAISKKGAVIWNGIETDIVSINDLEKNNIRKKLFGVSQPNEIIIALVGRISRWKGQMMLLDVFYKLSNSFKNVKLVFVGSPPPNQERFQQDLENKIAMYQLEKRVLIIPFQNDIYKVWQSIDIAVVPSTEPEPFGMVAIEAMLAKKAVIASNHGGLSEIIDNMKTGFLITPNSEQELRITIEKLINNHDLRKEMGENGYEKVMSHFSVEKYVKSFEKLFKKI